MRERKKKEKTEENEKIDKKNRVLEWGMFRLCVGWRNDSATGAQACWYHSHVVIFDL